MGILDIATGGVISGINGLMEGTFGAAGDALGISGEARKWKYDQKRMDKEFELNEKAAENAFARQNAMNDKTFIQNSPEMKRQQLEAAGLSPALAYGGGGAAGGGAGSSSAAPQGGASMPGGSANATQFDPLVLSQAKLNEAEAEKAKAEAKRANEEATTEGEGRDIMIEKMRQEGITTWLANEMTKYMMDDHEDELIKDQYWMNFSFHEGTWFTPKSGKGREALANVLTEEAKAEMYIGEANNQNAQAILNNEKTKWIYLDTVAALLQGNAALAKAKAEELDAETRKQNMLFLTGQKTNWKTWVDLGLQGGKLLIDGAATIGKYKIAGEMMKNAGDRWEQEMNQRMTEEEGRNQRHYNPPKHGEDRTEIWSKDRRTKQTTSTKY